MFGHGKTISKAVDKAVKRGVKQVIVVRKDLKMRRGKEIAQASHASMAWLAKRAMSKAFYPNAEEIGTQFFFSIPEYVWLEGGHTKVTVQVSSEKELLEVYQKAVDAGLTAHLITDAGRTEFNGVPTKTCVAIGPDYCDEVDKVTGDLTLY